MSVLLYIHVIGATVWVGGLIVMGGLVPAVRSASSDRAVIQAMARRFGVISWSALVVLVVTGTAMVMISFDWSNTLAIKIGLVMVASGLAAWHSLAGPNQTPRLRGVTQALILVLSLVIVGLALAL